MPPTRPLKVFLCHASADTPAVRELYELLKGEGWIYPWLDEEELGVGQHWATVIEENLDEADAVLVFLSHNSVKKEGFVQKELNYAFELSLEKPIETIFLIPFRLDDCEVPRRLHSRHWGDYFGDKKESTYQNLLHSLKKRYQQKIKLEAEEGRDFTEKNTRENAEHEALATTMHERTESEVVAKANVQLALLKKLPMQIDKPIEVKQEKPKLNKVVQIPKVFKKSIIGIVIFVILVLGTLFGIYSLNKEPSPPTYEVIVPIYICTPESLEGNVYRANPQPWVKAIFDSAFSPNLTVTPPNSLIQSNEQLILNARFSAFQQLIKETIRWSDTQTVKLDDSSEARVTLTFISSELLQAVFLNQNLKDRSLIYSFQDQLQKNLSIIAEREGLLFLLTVTGENNSPNPMRHTVKIPIQSMVMRNASDTTFFHTQSDHNLEKLIDISSNPVFGYLVYPLAGIYADRCEWALDPKYNTYVVIKVPYIEVDGDNNERPYFWTIRYAPLDDSSMSTTTPVSILPSEYDLSLMTPLTLPPSDINQSNYWQDFARFVWNQITLGNY